MKYYILLISVLFNFTSCGNSGSKNQNNTGRVSGDSDTCNTPDAPVSCLFMNTPAELNNIMLIADSTEAGTRIKIKGQIFNKDFKSPFSGLIIYAYHTDSSGYYSKKGNETGVQKWHGHLYGYCKTDQDGKYEIITIRPGRYPGNKFPAHIHCAVKETDGNIFYLNDFVFSDDSLVTGDYLSRLNYKGDNGVINLHETGRGIREGSRVTVID